MQLASTTTKEWYLELVKLQTFPAVKSALFHEIVKPVLRGMHKDYDGADNEIDSNSKFVRGLATSPVLFAKATTTWQRVGADHDDRPDHLSKNIRTLNVS